MAAYRLPQYFQDCFTSHEEAIAQTVKSGTRIATGFATSEPSAFYSVIWDHIQKEDLTDLSFCQALFMAPHRLLVGDALSSKGLLNGYVEKYAKSSIFGNLASRANAITKKMEGLSKLIDHIKELRERRIRFISAFIGPASNMIIPANPLTRVMYPEYVGRNKTRMGVIDMQSIHFPDAIGAMIDKQPGELALDLLAVVLTPPDAQGRMSHGIANGATAEALELSLDDPKVKILLYLNNKWPFTFGYKNIPHTLHISRFKQAARERRLWIVNDDTDLPALPPHSFDNPSEVELAIAHNVVNHIEMNKEITYGRAIQVGIGGTGVLAIKMLADSSWHGRSYTEMLEPFTLDLLERGKIAGTHFIEDDGSRTMLDGKIACTFTLAEGNSDFYRKLNRNPNIIMAPSSRVVVPEGFYHGMGINNILSLDFQGHVNSAARDKNHYSGIGGAAAIIRGLSRGGVAYLCLKSTHRTPEGQLRSSILPFLPAGTPISLIGPDLMGTRDHAHFFLATEHGVTRINASTQGEFIRSIISVAHPRYRKWLQRRAWEEFRVVC